MDWKEIAHKAVDRLYVLALAIGAMWYAHAHNANQRINDLDAALKGSMGQVETFAKNVEGRLQSVEKAAQSQPAPSKK